MYSADFRCLALRLLKTFGSYHRAAKACGISTSTLHRWNTTLERRTRRMTPKRKLTLVVVDKIKQLLVESTGVLTLNHIQLHLEHSGSRLCRQTISHAVKHLCGFSRKRVSRRFGGKRDPVVQKHLVDAFEERPSVEAPRITGFDVPDFSSTSALVHSILPLDDICVFVLRGNTSGRSSVSDCTHIYHDPRRRQCTRYLGPPNTRCKSGEYPQLNVGDPPFDMPFCG